MVANIELLNAACLWMLTALCLALWCFLLVRWKRGHRLFPDRSPGEAPWGLIDIWMVIFFWLGGAFVAGALRSTGLVGSLVFTFLAGLLTLAATAAGIVWLRFRYRDKTVRSIVPARLVHDVAIGGLAFVAVVPPIFWLMAILVQFFRYHHETLDMIQQNPSADVIFVSFFSAALVAPISEEFFFRYVLQSWLQRLCFRDTIGHRLACIYGNDSTNSSAIEPMNEWSAAAWRNVARAWWPIVVSAATFAAMHLGQGPAPIALFALGLALGYLFQKTGSLLACIVLHACLNLYSLTWETMGALAAR